MTDSGFTCFVRLPPFFLRCSVDRLLMATQTIIDSTLFLNARSPCCCSLNLYRPQRKSQGKKRRGKPDQLSPWERFVGNICQNPFLNVNELEHLRPEMGTRCVDESRMQKGLFGLYEKKYQSCSTVFQTCANIFLKTLFFPLRCPFFYQNWIFINTICFDFEKVFETRLN